MNESTEVNETQTQNAGADKVSLNSPLIDDSRSLEREIFLFARQIDGLAETFPATINLIDSVVKEADQKLDEFENVYCIIKQSDEKGRVVTFPIDHVPTFEKLFGKREKALLASRLVPRTFVVSLVSQFDAFLGRILRMFFLKKPALLNASERTVTLSQLLGFDSIESAKEFVLEKEVESVLRLSHTEQFEWMEKKFQIELRRDLGIWTTFIELTERRNLFVHTNGIVSSQYLSVCQKHNVTLKPSLRSGKQLGVSNDYFGKAYECIFEIAIKLVHVLWRKIFPEERESADRNLNRLCYDLLMEQKYELACKLLDFATVTIKKHTDEQTRRIFIVNRAQAYKWKGDNDKASQIMNSEDWTAASEEFKLASAIIQDNFDSAIKAIRKIGNSGLIHKTEYREWPLFQTLRFREDFASIFQEIFNEPLVIVTEKQQNLLCEPIDDILPNHVIGQDKNITLPILNESQSISSNNSKEDV